MANEEFIEGIHFYFDESGLMVLTEKYLLARGFCCGNRCRHCPYNFENVPEARKTTSLFNRKNNKEKN